MSHTIPHSKVTFCSLDNPLFYPVKVIATPFLWVIAKVKRVFQIIFGFLDRLGVFPFGEWNRSYMRRKIIECYKGGCYDTHDRMMYNPLRLEQAFAVLKEIGGVRFNTFSKDGTSLDSMIMRYKDVKQKIEGHGGKIVDCFPVSIEHIKRDGKESTYYCIENRKNPKEYIDVILPSQEDEAWKTFSLETLSCLGLEKAEIKLKNGKTVEGFIMKHWDEKKPLRPKPGQCFVRANAPTESFPMAKRDVMRRILATRGDVLCFDYRGTGKSEGVPSEGGYFLDAETMVELAINEFGYAKENIWAEGFCLGGAVAVHLKCVFPEINLFIQNTFDSMLNTFKQQLFPANYLAPIGLDEVRSYSSFITAKVKQYSFDSVKKINESRGNGKKGVSIVFNTDTDKTVDPLSHFRLANALDHISLHTFSVMYSPEDRRKNGHSLDILANQTNWNKSVTFITAKDYPEILNRPISTESWVDWAWNLCSG